MKKSKYLKSLLGLTQDDMALVLNVSHSQFARYELGIRNISLASKQLLAEMLQYICGPEALVKTTRMAEQYAEKQDAAQRMLNENEYQLSHPSLKSRGAFIYHYR